MSSDWPMVNLAEVTELITGFPFKSKDYSDDAAGYKLLRGDNIVQGSFRWDGAKLWPNSKIIEKHHNYWLKSGDVVLAMDRPWIEAGLKYSQVTEADLPCLLVQRTSCLRAKKGINQDFLRYLISSKSFVEYVKLVQTGTAVPHISGKQILDYEFKLPPEDVRNEIGKSLRALDNKIELNRQTNQILEHIAQALFKSWFVDFEPTRAKIAAKQAEQDPERAAMAVISGKTVAELDQLDAAQLAQLKTTAALFPGGLVESELGEVPEGWEVGALSDVANIIMGQSPKGDTYNNAGEGMPLVNGPVEFGNYHTKKIKWTTAPTRLSSDRDLIICVRGSTTGRFVKSDGIYCLGRGVCALQAGSSQPFADYLFKREIPTLLGMTTGSTFPSWNGPVLRKHQIIKPSDVLIKAFSTVVESIEHKISNFETESKRLSEIRDTLLPKLLSGELSPTETEVA